MDDSPVSTRIEGRIGILCFNRPNVMNAFDTALVEATQNAMNEFLSDPEVLAIVIHGAGRCFSAGFDMKESAAKNIQGPDQWRSILQADFDFIMQFWHSPKPTIAAAHGFCIGGAFEVLMACDLAVAGEATLFGEPEVRFGSGIVAMLAPYVISAKHARELLLIGDTRISAQRCYEMGLINRIVPEGDELRTALDLANQIASASAQSVQMTKHAINGVFAAQNIQDALGQALEIDVQIEGDMSPKRTEFNRIRREQGLKAALIWRDKQAR